MGDLKIQFSGSADLDSDTFILLVEKGQELGRGGAALDQKCGGLVRRALEASSFEAKKGATLELWIPKSLSAQRLLLVGIGERGKLESGDWVRIGNAVMARLWGKAGRSASIILDLPKEDSDGRSGLSAALLFVLGLRAGCYRFDKYKTKSTGDAELRFIPDIMLVSEDFASLEARYLSYEKVMDGVNMTRNLVDEPANMLGTQEFVDCIRTLSDLGVTVEVLDEAVMRKLGMNALLGVAQGSVRPPYLVILRWDGNDSSTQPIAIVGKGVVFDSGGISIKPSAGMEEMKADMAGAAVVAGLLCALASRKARVNVVGVIGLVENMPDGKAQRPSDVVKTISGQTIEVINTDAEGRLVLADALWYTQDRFKPSCMIDLATLTGAVMIALGEDHAGLFSNDDRLARQLIEAGKRTGEKLWQLPLGAAYDRMIDSKIADMKNVGGRYAGSITAAQFLQRHVNGVTWAHLDIAGTAMLGRGKENDSGAASGFGVRLLDEFIRANFEQ